MHNAEQKAHWRHAQTLALLAFLVLSAVLLGLFEMLGHVRSKNFRDILEFVLYAAAFFAVFTINPMTHYFYGRLTRR